MIDAQAYVLRETGVVPELEDIQIWDELSSGQVLVKVLYSGICATQMEEIFVSSRNAKYMPHLFGHEGVGVVEKVGPGVTSRKVGDTCVIHWRQSSVGLDANPGNYFVGGKKINGGKVVTFSSRVVVPENRLTQLPDFFQPYIGPLLGCSLTTGWGSVVKLGRHQSNHRVLVVGLGAVGSAAAWAARLGGSEIVWGVDAKTGVAARWEETGVTNFFSGLHSLHETRSDGLSIATIDLAIDTSGNSEVIEYLVENLSPTARLILVGMPTSEDLPRFNFQRLLDGLSLEGSNGGAVDPGTDIEIVGNLFSKLLDGQLSGSVRAFSRDSLGLAIAQFREGNYLRTVIDFG